MQTLNLLMKKQQLLAIIYTVSSLTLYRKIKKNGQQTKEKKKHDEEKTKQIAVLFEKAVLFEWRLNK